MQIADKSRDTKGLLIVALICGVLQLALAPNIALGNGRANFALVFAAVIALSRGGSQGVVAGFCAGLFFDLSTTGPIGLMAGILTVASHILGSEQRNRMAGDFAASVVSFSAASLACSVVYSLAMLLVGQSSSFLDALFLRAVPTAFLTIVAFLPFAYYFSRVKAGGSGLSGGHFSRRGL